MAMSHTDSEHLADFETALSDPAAYFADPESIVADDELTLEQKTRFLTEWMQDVTDRQQAADEGMDSVGAHRSAAEGELLRRLHKSLEQLKGQTEPEGHTASKSFWKRLFPI